MSDDTIDVTDTKTTPLFLSSPERIGLAIGDELEDWCFEFADAHDAVTWYSEAEGEPVSVCIPYVRADLYESLQAQLAAANVRADGLQKIVDAARAQKPAAWQWQCVNGDWFNPFSEKHLKDTAEAGYPTRPLYAAPVPAQPAVVPEGNGRSSD